MKTAVEWLVDELYKQGISLYTPNKYYIYIK
jgi:hypothetical protein